MTTRAVTSASNYFRRNLCPGSAREEAKYGEEPDTEFSEEGTFLHRHFLTLPMPKSITQAQRDVLTLANHYAYKFLESIVSAHGITEDDEFETHREVSLTLTGAGAGVLMPGHADIIRTWPSHSVRAIIDAKFGFSEVDEAPENDQLAIYAVMAAQIRPVLTTHVGIVQPRNFGTRLTSAYYDDKAISAAEREIIAGYAKSLEPDAPLIAGEKQCHFCRAKVKCPAYSAKFGALTIPTTRAIESCSNDELIRLYQACSFANKIREQVSNELRSRIKAGTLPGTLRNTGDERTVINPVGMYEAFKSYFGDEPGWNVQRYDECRQMSWGKLESYVRELTGLSENKAKELVHTLADQFCKIEPKAKRPVIQ